MKLWIVTAEDSDTGDTRIVGVFSEPEWAEEARLNAETAACKESIYIECDIEVVTLDEPVAHSFED